MKYIRWRNMFKGASIRKWRGLPGKGQWCLAHVPEGEEESASWEPVRESFAVFLRARSLSDLLQQALQLWTKITTPSKRDLPSNTLTRVRAKQLIQKCTISASGRLRRVCVCARVRWWTSWNSFLLSWHDFLPLKGFPTLHKDKTHRSLFRPRDMKGVTVI